MPMEIFNVPESEEQSPEARKADDFEKVNVFIGQHNEIR